jgi:hypothetical protein
MPDKLTASADVSAFLAAANKGAARETLNLPAMQSGDGGKALVVNTGENGYQHADVGLQNFEEDRNTTSPNNTTPAHSLKAVGAETNIDAIITPKGNGAFILGPKPDGTSTGGNKRGANAVDLQTLRNNANQVASGSESVAIGVYNRSSGNTCIAIGTINTSTNYNSVAIGYGNNGGYGGVGIGWFNTASLEGVAIGQGNTSTKQATAIGSNALADRPNMFAHCWGRFSDSGDSQYALFVARNKTTTNSAVELFLYGSSARLTIPSSKVFHGLVKIVGVKSDGSVVARYIREVSIKNVGGTTSLVGDVITIGSDVDAGTSISITADDTNDALKIEVTGITSETWRWVATVEGVEVAYGS